ncbi:hypothetical protein EVAR_70320_1 [Eumeta japonica]|uniref:Uncharacterized protein n=1 Tax=Eumeta variegata TaxID=151549 RepID=A0A4C2A402_EUMVA|nr:hypothetical protein EVAR_70308_1 [Eumeta japonica]GBP93954.1 hypothetical protein EVAR_70319_1 [Eumeta japonica]GBP93955.1 hypothetical protein EVAR_70320_1 [Eumeta japonica]
MKLGVRQPLIINRLTVHEQIGERCWFPRTVELFDLERPRHETWGAAAAYHKPTDHMKLGVRQPLIINRLTVHEQIGERCWFPRTVELFDLERPRHETWGAAAAYHKPTDRARADW